MRPQVLLSAADMQAVDARAVAGGADGFALMRRAGEAVARQVRRRVSRGTPIVVVAGSGNNGGDGAVCAATLVAHGHDVTLLRAGGEPREGSDAERAFAAWEGPLLAVLPGERASLAAALDAIAGAGYLVDALFGAGLSREVEGLFAELVRALDRSAAPLLAVDLPSGLDGNEHRVRGVAARATLTVSFVRLKPVHVLQPGRTLCGEVVIEDIGMPATALADAPGNCLLNAPDVWRETLPRPAADDHKFRRGHVLVRGGPARQSGAARLSASAALQSGAGLVTLAVAPEALTINAARLTAVMLRVVESVADWRATFDDSRLSTLLLGPGNGRDAHTRRATLDALASGRACVLDADALSCHGDAPGDFLSALRAARGAVVLTPHDGELERLVGHTDIPSLPSRLHRARATAALAGCVIVSKGSDSVVAAPDGRATIAVNAPPWLATAGAGDVLAGVVAALLAQGMPAFEAASAAVWVHGEAARTLGWPLTAEQLVVAVGEALNRVAAFAPPALPMLARGSTR